MKVRGCGAIRCSCRRLCPRRAVTQKPGPHSLADAAATYIAPLCASTRLQRHRCENMHASSTGTLIRPLRPQMTGVLERYGPAEEPVSSRLTLIAGKKDAKKYLVLVGGLTAGLLPCGFVEKLLARLGGGEWALAQAQLRSCYMVCARASRIVFAYPAARLHGSASSTWLREHHMDRMPLSCRAPSEVIAKRVTLSLTDDVRLQQFGLCSLDDDAEDLRLLAQHLQRERECTDWVLAGHSTGCQDAVRYVQRYGVQADGTPTLAGVALLAPVRTLSARWTKLRRCYRKHSCRGPRFVNCACPGDCSISASSCSCGREVYK